MAQSTELAVPPLPRGRPLYTEYLRRDGLDSWQEDARSVCDPGARRTSSMLHMQMEMQTLVLISLQLELSVRAQ